MSGTIIRTEYYPGTPQEFKALMQRLKEGPCAFGWVANTGERLIWEPGERLRPDYSSWWLWRILISGLFGNPLPKRVAFVETFGEPVGTRVEFCDGNPHSDEKPIGVAFEQLAEMIVNTWQE
jgi:hypothetical protein